tara:strand:+ start:176 stop:334 length:159 start_codon:yes stop_codon:yes gene_type:complete
MGANYGLKDVFGEYTDAQQECFCDMDWYEEHFPSSDVLLLENIVHTYYALSS